MAADKRLAKILALLAQAEGTNHPEEAKTFSAKAQELMTAWQIDEADLAAAAEASGSRVTELPADDKVFIAGWMTQAAQVQLWGSVAEANGVRIVMLRGYKGRSFNPETGQREAGINLHMFGFEANLLMTKMMVASLLIQAEREYRSEPVQAMARMQCSHPAHYIKWKNGFLIGFANGVYDQLMAAKRKAATGKELILAKRDEDVSKALAVVYPKLHKGTGSAAGEGAGLAQDMGYEAGLRANTSTRDQLHNHTRAEIGS